MNNLLLMLQFFTRIPIKKNLDCKMENFRRGTAWLVLIGIIMGIIQWCVFYVFKNILPYPVTAVLIVVTGVLLTGGLHMDGFGDVCDGFFAIKGMDRQSKESIIEIMKDSRIGMYACIGIILNLIIRCVCTYYIITSAVTVQIIIVPIMGKLMTAVVLYIGKPAKSTGSGNLFIGNLKIPQLLINVIFGIAITFFILPVVKGISVMIVPLAAVLLFYLYSVKKIDGVTGDCMGAVNEIAELMVLIVINSYIP